MSTPQQNSLVALESAMLTVKPQFMEISKSIGTQLAFERECSFAMQVLKENSYTASIAHKNLESLKTAIINCASMGLTLNTSQQLAYLVPRGGKNPKISFDISYKGLIALGVRDGAIISAYAEIVREGDDFKWVNAHEMPLHDFDPFCNEREKRKMRGVYVVAKLPSGSVLIDKMSEAEVLKARDCSAMEDKSIWKKWPEEMWKKTCIKHASKTWPKGGDKYSHLARAVDYLNVDNEEGLKRSALPNNADNLAKILYDNPRGNSVVEADFVEIRDEPISATKKIEAIDFINELVERHQLHDLLDDEVQKRGVSHARELTVEQQRDIYAFLNKKVKDKINKENI